MQKDYLALLESTGTEKVLLEIARGSHGLPDSQLRSEVEAWLRSKHVAAEASSSAKRDAREEETLAIARKASLRADRANLIAWIAAAIAAVSIIKEIIVEVFK